MYTVATEGEGWRLVRYFPLEHGEVQREATFILDLEQAIALTLYVTVPTDFFYLCNRCWKTNLSRSGGRLPSPSERPAAVEAHCKECNVTYELLFPSSIRAYGDKETQQFLQNYMECLHIDTLTALYISEIVMESVRTAQQRIAQFAYQAPVGEKFASPALP